MAIQKRGRDMTKEELIQAYRDNYQPSRFENFAENTVGTFESIIGNTLRALAINSDIAGGEGLMGDPKLQELIGDIPRERRNATGALLEQAGIALGDDGANRQSQHNMPEKWRKQPFYETWLDPEYWTSSNGIPVAAGNALGSFLGFIMPGFVGGKATVPGRMLLEGAESISPKFAEYLARLRADRLTNSVAQFAPGAGLEAFSNSAQIIDPLRSKGYPDSYILGEMGKMQAEELPYDMAANALSGNWLAGRIAPFGKTRAGRIASGLTIGTPVESAGEWVQESTQDRLQHKYSEEPYGTFWNPTQSEIEAGNAAALAALLFGGVGAVHSGIRSNDQTDTATQEPPPQEQPRGFNYNDFSDLNTTRPDPKRIYDFWRAYGMNQEAALGILASMDMESWGFQDSGITNEIGAFGLFQFYQGRKEDYLNWCQRNGIEHPEYALPQLQYVVEVDMKNQIGNARNPYNAYRVPLQSLNDFEPESLNQFKDPYQVAYHWEFGFERPGEDTEPSELDRRVDYWRQQLEGRDSSETQRSTIPSDHLETKYYQKWSRALDLDTPWDNQEYTDTVNFKPAMFEFLNDLGARMEAIGVTPIITGGADKYGHEDGTYSHANGYKVDIDDTRIPEGSEAHRILMQVAEEYGAEVVHEAENGHYDIVIRRDEPLRRAQTSPRYSGQPNREADGDNQSSEIEIPRPLFDINALMEEENIESGLTEQIMRDYLQSVKETGNEEQKELANRMLDSEGDFRMSRANVQEVAQREGENIVDFVTANEGRYLVPDEVRNMLGMQQKLRQENAKYAGDMETARDATEKMNYWLNRGKNPQTETQENSAKRPPEWKIPQNGMTQDQKNQRIAELLMNRLSAEMQGDQNALAQIDRQISQLKNIPIVEATPTNQTETQPQDQTQNPVEDNQPKTRRTPPEILDAVKLTGKKPRDAGTLHVEMLDDNKVKLRGEMKQTKGNPVAFNGLKNIAKEIGGTYNSRSKTFNFQNPEDAELFSQTAQIYLDNGMESLDKEPPVETRPWDNVDNNKDEVPQEISQGSRQETKEYPDKEIDYKQPNPLQTPEQNQTAEQPIQKPAKIDQPAPDTTPQPRVNENKIAPMEDNPLTRNNPILQSDKQRPDKDVGEVDANRLTQKLTEKNDDDQNQNGISDEAERIFNDWWNRRKPDRKNPKIAQIMDDTQDRAFEKVTQTRDFGKQIEIVKDEIRRAENIISKIRPWDKHLKDSKMNEKDEGIARNESKDIPAKEIEKGSLSDYKQAEEKPQDKEVVGNPTDWLNQAQEEQEEAKRPRARKMQGTHVRKHRPIQEVEDFGDDIHEEDEEDEVRDVYPADEVDEDDELIDEPSKSKTSPTEEDIVQKYNDKIEKRIQKNTFRVRVVNESDEIIGYDKESRNYRFRKAEDAIDFARDIMKTPDFESIAIDVHTDSGNTKFIFKAYKSDIEINVIEQEEFKRLHQQLKKKEIDGYQYIKEVAMLVSEYKIKVNGSFSDEDLENTTIDITGEYVEEPKQLPSARVEDAPEESAESKQTESKESEQKKPVHKYFPDSATAKAFFAETIGIQPKQPIKNQESTTDDTIKIVDAFDDSEEHEQELLKQLRTEMSKLSANPVFNPKIWTISLEIGGIYVQRGINSFATWAKQMTDSVGDEITPWLNSIWTTLKSYPAGQKFDQKQVTAMSQMLGSWREEGITSVDEIKSKFKDEFGEDLAKQFDSMIDASFKGISTFFTEQESTETTSEKTPEPAESKERTLVDELNDKQFAEDLMIKTQPITFDEKDLETGELEVVQQFADDIATMDNFSSTQRYSKVKIRRDENDALGREYMFSDINKAVDFINAMNDKTKVNETKIDGIGGATIFQQTRGLKPQIDRSQGRVHVMEFQEVDRTPKKKLGQQNNSNQTERDSRISDKFNAFLKSINPSLATFAMKEISLKPRRKIESLARDENNQFRFEEDKYYVGDERITRPEAAYFNYLRYTSGGEYLGKIAPRFFETLHFTHDENRKPTDEEIANGTYIESNEHLRPLFYRKLKVEKYPELKRWIERELKMPANGYEEALRVRRENRLQRIWSREISDEDLQAMEDAFKEDREVIVPSIEGSPETENATPNNSVTLPEGYRTESGRDINEADKDEFIVDKDGNRDFGEISKEISEATQGIARVAPIRLQVGNDDFGLKHIFIRHKTEIEHKGFKHPIDFIKHTLKNFDKVYTRKIIDNRGKPHDRIMLYCASDDANGFMPMDLELEETDDKYYNIITIQTRTGKIKEELIYDGSSSPSTAPTDGALSPENADNGRDGSGSAHVKSNSSLEESVTSDDTEGNVSSTFSNFIKLFQNQNQAGTNQNRESLLQHLTPARQKRLELLATHKGLKFTGSKIDDEKISIPEAIYFNYLRYINGDEYLAVKNNYPDLTVKIPQWLNTVLFQSDQGNNEFIRPLMERKLKGRPFLRQKLENLYNQEGSNYIFQRIWQADEELLGIYELGEKFKDKGGKITYSDENHAHGIIIPTTYELAFPNGKKVTIKTEKKKNGLKQARKRVKSLLKKYLERVSQKETEAYLKEHNIHFKVEKIGSQDIGEISQDDNPQTKEIAGEKESSELDKIEQLNQMNLTDTPFSNDQISKNIASVVWNFKDKISPINSSDAKYRVDLEVFDRDKAWQKNKRPFLFQNSDDAYEFAKEIHKQTGISVTMFEQSPQGDKIQYINHGARLQFDPMAKKSNKKIKSDTLDSALFALDELSAMFYKKAEQILKSRGEKIERSDIRFIRENRTYTAKEEAAKRGEMAIEPAQVKKILPKSFDVLRKRMDLGLALPQYSSREIATKIYDFESAFDEAFAQDLQALEQNQTTDQSQAEMIADLVEKSAVNEKIQESSPEETVDEVKEHTDESSQDLDDAIKLRDNKLKGLNGKSLTIYSENNENEMEFNARYKIVDASELITSHEHLGGMYGINRNYPQALQPRDRMRVAMQDGISKMAGSLKPRKITASEDLNLGAPVVRSDGVVLNGNGRTLAIITAYSRDIADKYRNYLIEHAEDYGIDAAQISKIDRPILIREITDNLDLSKTQEIIGAVLGGTQLGESEQAVNDAKKLRLKDLNGYVPVKNGNIAATQNATFLDNVANRIIPQDEYNKHTTSGGQWNASAIRRVKQALIALAYPDNELVAKMTESTEDDIKNISNALDYAKADVAHAVLMMKENHAYPYKLSETITRAVQRYDKIKRGDGDVQNFIKHNETALTDRESDEVLRMLEILEANKRKASKLGEILSSIARVIEAQGDPQLSDMFSGTVKRETLMEIINRVNSDTFFSSQTSLLSVSDHTKIPEMFAKIKRIPDSKLTAREKAIQQMGSQLGVPVVFFDGDKKLHGYFTRGTSFINRNSATSLDWTFWHESFHSLQARDPNLYNKILSEIKKSQSFTDEQIQAYRREIGAFELSDDRIIEEMLADNMSQAARRSGILDSIRGNRNLFERFVDFIRDIYNRVKDYFNTPKNGLTKAQREAMNRSVSRIAGSMKNLGIDSKPSPKMSEKKGVVEVTGKEFGDWSDIKDFRKKAIQYYTDYLIKNPVQSDLLGQITFTPDVIVKFTGSGRNEVKSHSADPNKLLLIKYLPQLIKSATKARETSPYKEKHRDKMFYYLRSYAKVDGEYHHINITVFRSNDKNFMFYNHDIKEIVTEEEATKKEGEPLKSAAPESSNEALGSQRIGSPSDKSLSDVDTEIKFSLDGHFNSVSDTLAKNLGLKPTSNRISIIDSKPIDDINLKQYYFGSPSRIKNQTFQFFFENARRGMQKLVQLRNNYARKFKVAMDLVSDDKARDNLYELLWRGDEEGVEYGKLTSAEKKGKTVDEIDQIRADRIVKETGVHKSAAIAYVKIRRLLEAVYRQLDARKRGIKNRTVYVKPQNLSKALKSFEGNKFVTIMRIGEKNSDGKIPVAIREAQHWTDSAKNLTQAQLEQFQKDPVIQITRSKQNKDGTFNISYRRGKAGLTRLEGHLPHLFHHYTVRVKKKVGDEFVTTKDLEDKLKSYHAVIGSGKSQRDAIKVAEEWLKSHTLESDEQIFIEPHMFNFESLGVSEDTSKSDKDKESDTDKLKYSESSYAPTMGDKDFYTMQRNIAEKHGITLKQAREMVAGSVRSTSRHRFNGYFLKRHGSKGFEQDIQYVLRHYLNSSARYIAMDEVKENAINKFERVFGAFDKDWNDHDLAQYVKNYIRDVNGNPSTLENTINNALNKSELWRNIFVPHFGDRAAISVTNSITSRLGYLTLGFFNMSSALLNFSQLINAAGYLGTLSDAGNLGKYFCKYFRGLKSGDGRISMRDLSILQKTGALNEIGLDSSSGYDQFRGHTSDFAILNALDWVGNKSMGLFQKTDALCRIATTLAAYDQAKSQGKSDAEAIKYAREINRKSNFDYSVADAPNIFRRGSIISQLALQFRKYGIKELEVMHDFLSSATSKKQKMMFWIPYFLAVGLMGVPAGDGLDWLFKDFFNIGSPKNFVQESIMEACGDSPEGRALGRALMYGIAGAAGVNISSRVGMQDVIPYRTSDFAGVAASKTYNLISDLFNEGFGLQAIRDVSPGAYNILAAAIGESRGARGRLNSTYDDFFERALRAIGFKSTDETISADIQRIIYDKRDKLADDKKKAIDAYLDNPTAENARILRKLGVKPSTVQEERKRKRMERLGRIKSLLSKQELKDNRQLLNFAR